MMKMMSLPVDDMYVKGGQLREDGRLVHPMYLVRVKTPAESSREWDYYHVLSEIPGNWSSNLRPRVVARLSAPQSGSDMAAHRP